jgi:hypothetical protein
MMGTIRRWLSSAQVLRWSFFIAYGVVLLLGNALIVSHERGRPVSFTVERKLPANWLLQSGDLAVLPGDHPWYLKHEAPKDQKMELGDLSTVPTITEKPGKLSVAFSVGSAMVKSGAINATTAVRVCQGPKALIESAEVQAVLCPASDAPCVAFADIPADKATALAGISQESTPVSLQVMSSQCQ